MASHMQLLLLFLLAAAAAAQSLDPGKVDAAVELSMKSWGVPGAAIAIVQDDRVVVAKGYGVKDVKTKQPVTANTLFAIGSTTKAFTTAAMAILADDGKMNWDDRVQQHIPFFRLSDPIANELVTMRDLVTHRTGLVRNDLLWYNSPWSREEILRKAGHLPLAFPIRQTWSYQNIMYLAAGYAVGLISGSTWEDFTQKRIFDPLGMKTSNFSSVAAEKAADHATPHDFKEGGSVEVIPWRNLDNVGPAGSINSSASELTHWVRLHLNKGALDGKRLISEKNMREMHTPQMVMPQGPSSGRFYVPGMDQISYGLGWAVHDYRGHLVVTHGGAIDGFRTQIAMIPARRLGVVVLSNLGDRNMPEALRLTLLDLALNQQPKDWDSVYIGMETEQRKAGDAARAERERKRPKSTRPSLELASYAGDYVNPAYGTAKIAVKDGKLNVEWSRFSVPLQHDNFDTFRAQGGRLNDTAVSFRLNASGDAASLSMLDQDFRKVNQR